MIRLTTTAAAVTAPLPASAAAFPGIRIGRSEVDGRPFHLSPVQVPVELLPSTSSLAFGGLGSGKSATAKARIRREILERGHQAVVVDSFGEDAATGGEWAPLVRSLGGQIIRAGDFTLNPLSELLPPQVREQLVRSLILSVEPAALTPHSTHALQHALTHPKATTLTGLVDALISPEDGRWSAERLTAWGEHAAIALSRYTEGSMRGLFDGPDAGLPPADLPILSLDFTALDRSSPAIPSLMAAVACWAEHVWLPQSTAPHRHLVLEEAWEILLSPATAGLMQRLLKNSRKAGLSLDCVMHTLSDLGSGQARDLARLCEVAYVGRLGPEEAEAVGALLGLPAWATSRISTLLPGQAVWKVGPSYVDIVHTVLNEEEAALTDTSTRRRAAQRTPDADDDDHGQDDHGQEDDGGQDDDRHRPQDRDDEEGPASGPSGRTGLDALLAYDQEPDDPDTARPHHSEPATAPVPTMDSQHQAAIDAARAGRLSEAADLAALGERADIRAYGI
ncbi:hypothetical protein C6N75_24365, partial [Streptomyces solincola]